MGRSLSIRHEGYRDDVERVEMLGGDMCYYERDDGIPYLGVGLTWGFSQCGL